MIQRLNFAAVGIVCAVITYYSVYKPVSVAGGYSGSNYLLHSLAYFGLSAVLLLYFQPTKHGIMESILLASAVGIGIELIQFDLAYRTFSVYDILANSLGALSIVLDYQGFAIAKLVSFEDKIVRYLYGSDGFP